jgi:hypothetical protein
MISSKDLTPDQVEAIKSWATAGDQLPDIQGKLLAEYSLNATYMDTRFLILDLGIELESEEEAEETESAETPASPLDPAAPAGGAVTVELDELTRPGAMVSGRIVFSDGEKAVWFIDQTGRPGLETDTPEYQPVEEDLIEFEKQLRALMAQEGGGEGA